MLGAMVKVTCSGGRCPRKSVTLRNRRGTVAQKAFSGGMAKIITIRADKRPTIATKTLR